MERQFVQRRERDDKFEDSAAKVLAMLDFLLLVFLLMDATSRRGESGVA